MARFRIAKKQVELFVTQNYNDQSVKTRPFQSEINRLRIMIAKRTNGKWIQITEFPYNNPAYSVGHPTVTESGDTFGIFKRQTRRIWRNRFVLFR